MDYVPSPPPKLRQQPGPGPAGSWAGPAWFKMLLGLGGSQGGERRREGGGRGNSIGNTIGNSIGNTIGNTVVNTIGNTIGNSIKKIRNFPIPLLQLFRFFYKCCVETCVSNFENVEKRRSELWKS